jgi:hypothetical protein
MPAYNIFGRKVAKDGSRKWATSFTVEAPSDEYARDAAYEADPTVEVEWVTRVPGTEDVCTWEDFDEGLC